MTHTPDGGPIPHLSDYKLLTDAGHSPAKAVEILIDAKRGDQFCIGWIETVRENLRGVQS